MLQELLFSLPQQLSFSRTHSYSAYWPSPARLHGRPVRPRPLAARHLLTPRHRPPPGPSPGRDSRPLSRPSHPASYARRSTPLKLARGQARELGRRRPEMDGGEARPPPLFPQPPPPTSCALALASTSAAPTRTRIRTAAPLLPSSRDLFGEGSRLCHHLLVLSSGGRGAPRCRRRGRKWRWLRQ